MTYRLNESVGFQLTKAARANEREIELALSDLDLTRLEWCILVAIGEEDIRTPTKIADFLWIDRSSASRTLRALEKKSLVRRTRDPADARRTVVILTDIGIDRMKLGLPVIIGVNRRLMSRLSAEDEAHLRRILLSLNEGIERLSRF